MEVYSKKILRFLAKQRRELKRILSIEMKIAVAKTRFVYKGYTYPIQLVLFEDSRMLGYFHSHDFRIGLNKVLLYNTNQVTISNILRHELAHYMTYIDYPDQCLDVHGSAFNHVCFRYGWGRDVSMASISVSLDPIEYSSGEQDMCPVTTKIKKLMSLATSDNPHEAQVATSKANALLLKYNIEQSQIEQDEEEVCVARVLQQQRRSAKHDAIARILNTFSICSIHAKSQSGVCIELVGERVAVSITAYVADFLDHELERQWQLAKQCDLQLKGQNAKYNFMHGLATGYVQKIEVEQQQAVSQAALLVIERQLEEQLRWARPNLRRKKQHYKHHHAANMAGKKAGEKLIIKQAVSSGSKDLYYLT